MDKLKQLQEASERATPGPLSVEDCTSMCGEHWLMAKGSDGGLGSIAAVRAGCGEMSDMATDKDNADFIALAWNFTRSILDGTFLDDETVERAARALFDAEWGEHGCEADFENGRDYWLKSARAALQAALGGGR